MTLLYIKQYGNVFEVRVRTDVALNAWQGKVILPADLKVNGVSYGGSIGDVWQMPPALSALEIDFAGGRTAGFTGDGALFRFTASSAPVAPAELIKFDPARTTLYAADGQGTKLVATLQPITINARDLAAATSTVPVSTAIPEPFTILVVHDQQILDGREAVIFSATDPDSGIDHYEVQEYTSNGIIGWHEAVSPYLIDQKTTMISVKAVDRSGDYRIEEITFPRAGNFGMQIALLIGICICAAVAAVFFTRSWQKKSSR